MADVTVTAAAPTFPIPNFLLGWEADISTSTVHVFKKVAAGTAPGAYDKVQLHNFKFLGQEFGSSGYVGRSPSGGIVSTHSGAGVCAEFKLVLVAAQRRIYQDFARQRSARGQNPDDEDEFKGYCGIKAKHVGWQFRGGNHRFGNAIDIDSLFNPYIVVGSLPDALAGEQPIEPPQGADIVALKTLRQKTISAYQRATAFMLGPKFKSDDTKLFEPVQTGETSQQVFSRFALLHEALTWYMSTAMQPRSNNSLPLNAPDLPRTLDDMRERLRLNIDFKLGKVHPELRELLSNDTKLSAQRDQIVDDHETVRQTMLFGNWRFQGGRVRDASSTRDPCNGMLSLRREVVVGIRESGTRWGAADFGGRESGDIMHFDTLTKPALTQDSNPSQITFAAK